MAGIWLRSGVALAFLASVSVPAAAPAADVPAFEYSIPPKAAAIPLLRRYLRRQEAQQRRAWDSDVAAARRDDPEMASRYLREVGWSVVADTPGFLSLSLEGFDYSGGAHGNSFYDALLWNKAAKLALKPIDLFLSKAALRAATQTRFCAEIDRQRAEKREGPVDRKSGEMFDDCIDPNETTLILGSSTGRAFDRIGFLVAPYAAGPYSEGSFDVTIPVTPAILAAVKPAYRGYFAAKTPNRVR